MRLFHRRTSRAHRTTLHPAHAIRRNQQRFCLGAGRCNRRCDLWRDCRVQPVCSHKFPAGSPARPAGWWRPVPVIFGLNDFSLAAGRNRRHCHRAGTAGRLCLNIATDDNQSDDDFVFCRRFCGAGTGNRRRLLNGGSLADCRRLHRFHAVVVAFERGSPFLSATC